MGKKVRRNVGADEEPNTDDGYDDDHLGLPPQIILCNRNYSNTF